MKKTLLIPVSIILVFILFFHLSINKYYYVYKPLKDYYLTAFIPSKNKAYVYDLSIMKGYYVENSFYSNIIMVTQYKNEENYIAFVENEKNFFLIEFVSGKINNTILLPASINKLATWENKIVFSMENAIYSADFNTNSYYELVTMIDNKNTQEAFFVFDSKILYAKTNSENTSISDWYIYDNSKNTFVISTNSYSPIYGWISKDEILLNSNSNGNYIYNLDSQETTSNLITKNIYPPSCILREQNILITHTPQKLQANTSEVIAIDIKTNKKIKLWRFPLDCVGSGGMNFELSKKDYKYTEAN